MRILHVSDIHGSERQLQWLVQKSVDFDLLTIGGDLLDLNAHRPLGDQLDRVVRRLRKIETPMAISSGNHDSLAGAGPQFEQARWLRELRRDSVWVDGDKFKFDGHMFRCVGWMGAASKESENEVWLIHGPPEGARTAVTRGGASFGDFNFGEQCKSGQGPRLALSGHVHDPERWWARLGTTTSINSGFAPANEEPNHVIIDLRRGIAELIKPVTAEIDIIRLW